MRNGSRCRVLAGVVALAAISGSSVAAVGGSAGAAVASKAFPKACALFSSDIATSALGGPVNPGTQTQPNPRETICKYARADGMGFGDVEAGSWTVIQPLSGTKVPGLGDQAINDSGIGLSVRKGSNGFTVSLSLAVGEFSGAAADQLTAAELSAEMTTARQLLAKLGVRAPTTKRK